MILLHYDSFRNFLCNKFTEDKCGTHKPKGCPENYVKTLRRSMWDGKKFS